MSEYEDQLIREATGEGLSQESDLEPILEKEEVEKIPDSCLPPKDILRHLGFETID